MGLFPSVMRSILWSNTGSLSGAITPTLSLTDDLIDEIVTVGVFSSLLFTSSFIPSLELYKMVFNTLLL